MVLIARRLDSSPAHHWTWSFSHRHLDWNASIGPHALHHALHIHRQSHHLNRIEWQTARHDIVLYLWHTVERETILGETVSAKTAAAAASIVCIR